MTRKILVRTATRPTTLDDLKTLIRTVEAQADGPVNVDCDISRLIFEYEVPVETDAERLDPRDAFPRDALGRFTKRK